MMPTQLPLTVTYRHQLRPAIIKFIFIKTLLSVYFLNPCFYFKNYCFKFYIIIVIILLLFKFFIFVLVSRILFFVLLICIFVN